MKKFLYRLLIVICIGVIAFSGYQLVRIYLKYKVGTDAYKKTASQAVKSKGDDDKNHVPISVDFDKLKAENPDVVGWLYCKGTPINYPVVQGKDNSEYLHKLFNGTRNFSGTLFVDVNSPKDMSGPNTIIYGHAMKNGSMFGMLGHFKKASYYKKHKYMWYLTPEGNYRLDLIRGYTAPADSLIYSAFDLAKVQAVLAQTESKSDFNAGVDRLTVSKIVTLSTCAYDYDDARYIVITVPTRVDQ